MTEQGDNPFLDVPALLERSVPRAQTRWVLYAGGGFVLMLALSAYTGAQAAGGSGAAEAVSAIGMIGLVVAMGVMIWRTARAVQREQQEMQAAEELIQLRRWDQAAMMLQSMLSRPARSLQARVQSLIYLAAVLARYHRHSDVVAVYDHLLGMEIQNEPAVRALRLGRAMSLLQEERLFDVDRAISDLRRGGGAAESGGLALVEIYRDVKTGHPQEAIDLFQEKLPILRRQLGCRVGDAYALAARAYDLMGREQEAASAYETATVLSEEAELHRRYPEVAALAGKYAPVVRPTEAP